MGSTVGNATSRNPMIELWRVAFSVLIFACHTTILPWYTSEAGLFKSASIGVEFFFVLSGFLMAQSEVRCSRVHSHTSLGSETLQFIYSKAKGLYPTYFFALCLEFLVASFLAVPDKKSFSEVIYYVWDILFLRLTGLQGNTIDMAVGASWYLSGMILAMWIIYPLLRKYTDMFLHVLAPLVSVFLMGWFSNVYGSIKFQLDFNNGICLGLLRAIAELCVGCVCFMVYQQLQTIPRKTLTRMLATVGELGSLGSVFLIARHCYRSQIDFICILLIAVGITLSFSGLSYTQKMEGIINVRWIGKFSLALYLSHVVWIRMLNRWKIPIPFGYQVVIAFILSIVTAFLCVYTIELITQIRKSQKKLGE